MRELPHLSPRIIWRLTMKPNPPRTMQDITPPRPSMSVPNSAPPTPRPSDVPPSTRGSLSLASGRSSRPGRSRGKLAALIICAILLLCVAGGAAAGYYWYQEQLRPVDTAQTKKERFIVPEGASAKQVGDLLQQKGFIRSELAFTIYHKLHSEAPLKAGVYLISKSSSMEQIIQRIESGKPDAFTIMFLPGGTIMDAKATLVKAGFAAAEVDAAFIARYDTPLMAGRPAGTDIEGFIYGNTYEFYADSTVKEVLAQPLRYMSQYAEQEKLEAGFKKQGLSLYQGITLASIIQSEVSNKEDMQRVAGVFYNRLKQNMTLGSDVTFIYAAKKAGVKPDVAAQTPYNTRIHPGLPPTPISNPGAAALHAAAYPATTDDLFFVAGDDGKTYFSKTNAEHEALTRQYCHKNCEL